ncbi:MAG: ASCH domain-containing protein [Phycisphaeraceae bacterium]|nr:ASCH domain-containing protein [Phycisphaeraceae bacterium]
MSVHVAILLPRYVDLILRGVKTIESRLYRNQMPPIGCAKVGERIYLKQSGGPFRAIARIAAVDEHRNLIPRDVNELARRYNESVCGDPEYWKSKRGSLFAAFITLSDVEPIDVGPSYAKSMRAWHVLADDSDVIHDFILTDGAIRNRYARLSNARGVRFTLLLPDGQQVDTDLVRGNMFRWRCWGRYYDQHKLRPGDRVRLIALGGRSYRVCFVHADQSRTL